MKQEAPDEEEPLGQSGSTDNMPEEESRDRDKHGRFEGTPARDVDTADGEGDKTCLTGENVGAPKRSKRLQKRVSGKNEARLSAGSENKLEERECKKEVTSSDSTPQVIVVN